MKKSLIFLLLLIIFPTNLFAQWEAPLKPDPKEILDEARIDAEEHHYEEALAKHVWFHKNALKYEYALRGVRLSFALSDWYSLGLKYQPALEKMQNIRDEAETNVKDGIDPYTQFNDFESINTKLGDENRTVLLFKWLDNEEPLIAKSVYRLAQPSLIKAREYSICAKYTDPEEEYDQLVCMFKKNINLEGRFGESIREFAQKSFSNGVSTLVALLVLDNRIDEAQDITSRAKTEWEDPDFYRALESALTGLVPPPWP